MPSLEEGWTSENPSDILLRLRDIQSQILFALWHTLAIRSHSTEGMMLAGSTRGSCLSASMCSQCSPWTLQQRTACWQNRSRSSQSEKHETLCVHRECGVASLPLCSVAGPARLLTHILTSIC
jgi:hypothetical protein